VQGAGRTKKKEEEKKRKKKPVQISQLLPGQKKYAHCRVTVRSLLGRTRAYLPCTMPQTLTYRPLNSILLPAPSCYVSGYSAGVSATEYNFIALGFRESLNREFRKGTCPGTVQQRQTTASDVSLLLIEAMLNIGEITGDVFIDKNISLPKCLITKTICASDFLFFFAADVASSSFFPLTSHANSFPPPFYPITPST
jgi:hypothetical protein